MYKLVGRVPPCFVKVERVFLRNVVSFNQTLVIQPPEFVILRGIYTVKTLDITFVSVCDRYVEKLPLCRKEQLREVLNRCDMPLMQPHHIFNVMPFVVTPCGRVHKVVGVAMLGTATTIL